MYHDNGRNRLTINKCGGRNFELAVMVEGFNCHVRCGGALVAVKWGMSGGDGIIAIMLVAGLSSNEGGRVVMGLVIALTVVVVMVVAIVNWDHRINVFIRQTFKTLNAVKLFPIKRIGYKMGFMLHS